MELTSNVFVNGKWYGPAYPDAGDPPAGAVTNPAAFADHDENGDVVRDEDDNPTLDGKPVEIEQPEESTGSHATRGRPAGAKRD